MAYNVIEILKGGVYRLFDINKTLKDERIEWTCKGCFTATRKDGTFNGWCNLDKGGCNCPMESKARIESQRCPLGFWALGWTALDKLDAHNKENNYTPSKEYLDFRKSKEL